MLKVLDLGINGIPDATDALNIGWVAMAQRDPGPKDPRGGDDDDDDEDDSTTSGPIDPVCGASSNTNMPRNPNIRPAKGPSPGCHANTGSPGPHRKTSGYLDADAVAQIRQQLSVSAN